MTVALAVTAASGIELEALTEFLGDNNLNDILVPARLLNRAVYVISNRLRPDFDLIGGVSFV